MARRAIVIDAILLDVMGTLVYEPFFEEVPASLGMTLEELIAVKHPTAWLEFERGEIDEATFASRFFADGRAYPHERMRQAMVDAYDYLPGIVPLLEDLSARGHDLHLLSNYPVWYRLIENKLMLSRYAKWSFVSCELGVRKPDRAIFETVSETLDLPPERLLFVDDRERNTAAAAELGMDTIVFQSAPQLRRELGARSLL